MVESLLLKTEAQKENQASLTNISLLLLPSHQFILSFSLLWKRWQKSTSLQQILPLFTRDREFLKAPQTSLPVSAWKSYELSEALDYKYLAFFSDPQEKTEYYNGLPNGQLGEPWWGSNTWWCIYIPNVFILIDRI